MELVLENVTKSFGGLRAVGGVSFSVPEKTIFGLIGPNGAGKTTVFNLVTGVYKPDTGRIRFGRVELSTMRPAQIAGAGIARTFQNIRLFGQLTVVENLLVACELQKKAHLAAAVLRADTHYEDEDTMHARALELLRVFDLHEMADDAPTALSYGDQRRLEIARAMMLKPSVLLLDEPAAGMNYGEAEGLKTQIRWLRDTFDVAVVLVEHNMQVVMGVCEEIHVLDHGETIAHGTPEEIRADPKVLAAYLGEDEGAPLVRAAVEEASHQQVPAVVEARRTEKLSGQELERLSKDLTERLRRGLARPEEGDTPGASAEVEAEDPRLEGLEGEDANVDGVELAAPPARGPGPVVAESAPDVATLDGGWGEEDEDEGAESTDDAAERARRKKDVN